MTVPENRAAVLALHRVEACLSLGKNRRTINPLFLHGPSGVGKSYLAAAFIKQVARKAPQLTITVLSAADLDARVGSEESPEATGTVMMQDLRNIDLLVVEDLQYLPVRSVPFLSLVFDDRLARHAQMVFTASMGPRQLPFPAG